MCQDGCAEFISAPLNLRPLHFFLVVQGLSSVRHIFIIRHSKSVVLLFFPDASLPSVFILNSNPLFPYLC
nr:MAG TPA: hypothetical protein [Caudoviricetes sp.]